MIIQFGLAGCHITEYVMDDGDSFEAMVIVFRTLFLQISEFLHCLFDLLLFHEAESEIILSFEVDLYEFLFQLAHVG